MLEIEFLEIAQKELNQAFEYYELKQNNLGYRFIKEVKSLNLIKEYLEAWSKISRRARRCL